MKMAEKGQSCWNVVFPKNASLITDGTCLQCIAEVRSKKKDDAKHKAETSEIPRLCDLSDLIELSLHIFYLFETTFWVTKDAWNRKKIVCFRSNINIH